MRTFCVQKAVVNITVEDSMIVQVYVLLLLCGAIIPSPLKFGLVKYTDFVYF
jgi:hypothetical protein